MRVLITGATGFIGSHLAEQLHQKGYALRCLVRKTSHLRWIEHLPVEYCYGDLFDEEVLKQAVADVDYVYHVAGLTKAKTREEYFLGNHIGTKNLLDAVAKVNSKLKRFILVSSLAAVGPSLNGAPVNEETPYHPITAYGESKMKAEKECLKMVGRLPITIVRPPAVYGPRDRDVFEFFKAVNNGLQPMIGLRTKTVSLIYVTDLVDGIVLAGEHPAAAGKVYFISSEHYYSWKEVGEVTTRIMQKKAIRLKIPVGVVYTIAAVSELFSMATGKAVLLNMEKARDIVQDAWTCDISKAKRELGFRESYTLEDGIRKTVGWYREQCWLK
ncbi:MAG: nucleoside-diphosphate sugar epimerase [Ignavibacteria bacterium 13_1_40CM_2_61_4]|nr:MAG: nucleoside-diphosphate sugar epimerase [Ignavibacteria bacterium 13_1_40CM_2_61_4]